MKLFEHYAYRYGDALDSSVVKKWERFATTGNCGEIACVQCPFKTMRCMEMYKGEVNRRKAIIKKLNEEVQE
ncbi:MAG: hypothetical protein K2I95_10445 [Treponemataceae bacterium]|nr:hypothetical protein [Treponemataceae bacterium]